MSGELEEARWQMVQVPLWYRGLLFALTIGLAIASFWLGWVIAQ